MRRIHGRFPAPETIRIELVRQKTKEEHTEHQIRKPKGLDISYYQEIKAADYAQDMYVDVKPSE